ncbi:MAG: uroporphyrinogen-III synthase [Betaproteobacteria bacterium]|nr:uroporphyrinogen-III synthase [Betaproteobacteria bacterium]
MEEPQSTAALTAGPLYLRPLIIAAIIAVAIIAWQWYDSRQQIGALQHELAQRLAAADAENKQSRGVAEQVREATREAQIKLGVLEAKLQESQNQQIALEALYQELSRSRDESLLADVEQTLLVASQQLQLAGNVKSALIALQAADARLARLDRPQLAGLRKMIARDIERLKQAPYVDIIGISARIDNLMSLIDLLPLAMEARAPATATKGPADPETNAWVRFTRELWRDMRELVRIEKMDRPDVPLLTPAQTYFLRENLRLRLLGARLALLARDDKSFKADLKAAREWLARYYDGRDKVVINAIASTRQLADSQISIEVPDLAASLDAVRNYRLVRERAR